jgi:hypothetical protein
VRQRRLARSSAKATRLQHPLGAVVVADADEPPLPFADEAFDLVMSRHPVTGVVGGDRAGAGARRQGQRLRCPRCWLGRAQWGLGV